MIEVSFIENQRKKLEEERARLEKDLSRFAKPIDGEDVFETKFEDIGRDPDENATEVENYSDNLALEGELEKRLKEIQSALSRIADGSYGKCEVCGGDIDAQRLEAYPEARRCIEDAQ